MNRLGRDDRVRIVAVDFDGTLTDGAWVDFELNVEAVDVLRRFREGGGQVILWTCRTGEDLAVAVAALVEAGLEVDAVNADVPATLTWRNGVGPKVYADLYVDDRATLNGSVDWDAVADRLGVVS